MARGLLRAQTGWNRPQSAAANVQSLPAPVGGWNARDSLANMDPVDAVQLTNLFPNVSSVDLRGGYSPWATGLVGQVQTLLSYAGGNTEELWAFTSAGNLYDVTSEGAVGAPAVTGLTSGWWEYTNITTAGGSYLIAVNGQDAALIYDGSSWTTATITGVSSATLSNVLLFKHRVWFLQKDTLKAWYLPTDAISGAAQSFDLSQVARLGGNLVDFDAWTVDAGYGADDNLAFITSMGEVIVYRGTDPASAATWTQMGSWSMGSPIGTRCMLKYGGDLLILTYDGLIPMASALQSSRLDPRVALSDKIQGAITAATSSYGTTATGWQVVYNAKRNAVWINVPVGVGSQQQYVMNTITKAWCNFTNWAANCWEEFNDDPYFGGNGFVALAWDETFTDDDANIATLALQAFNYFGGRGVKKYFTRARPTIFTDGTPSIGVGMNVDFETADMTAPLSFLPTSFGLWDVGTWDSSLWGSGLSVTNTWLGITGIGYCGGLQFKTASMGTQIQWASTDVVYQQGWAGV
jgi:hypothetical protein